MLISINANKLAHLVEANDKRLRKLPKKGEPGWIPLTSFRNHQICQVPSLYHACTYERVLGLRPRDWLVPHEETAPTATIRGHERAILLRAALIATGLDQGQVYVGACGRLGAKMATGKAIEDLSDPAALAEILSETLRGFGVECNGLTHPLFGSTMVRILRNYSTVQQGDYMYDCVRARALLLRLLQLPASATSSDALREVEAA